MQYGRNRPASQLTVSGGGFLVVSLIGALDRVRAREAQPLTHNRQASQTRPIYTGGSADSRGGSASSTSTRSALR